MQKKLTLMGLAFPIFVENFLNRLLGMVNVVLLARLSQNAVAAIGVANQIVGFVTMIYSLITFGVAVVIAQNLGANDEKTASQAVSTSIVTNTLLGLALSLLAAIFHTPLLRMMNMDGVLLDYSSVYFTIIGGCSFLQAFNSTAATILRNYGHTREPMLVFFLMNIVNLVGNALVILHPYGLPDFGIAGVATCTVFSQFLASVALVVCFAKKKIKVNFHNVFGNGILKKILRIGIPGTGDGFACTVANLVLTYFVSAMGATALAAQTYVNQFTTFTQLFGFAVGQATQILVGYHCGAGEFDYAYKMAMRNTYKAMLLNVIVTVVAISLQKPILAMFTDSPEIAKIVFWCLLIDLIQEFGRPYNMVLGVSVRGAGDVVWAMFACIASIFLICIPLGYLLTQVFHLGLYGVFIALMTDEWTRGQLMHIRWRSRKWESSVLKLLHKEEEAVPEALGA